jgi:hypothetical protein
MATLDEGNWESWTGHETPAAVPCISDLKHRGSWTRGAWLCGSGDFLTAETEGNCSVSATCGEYSILITVDLVGGSETWFQKGSSAASAPQSATSDVPGPQPFSLFFCFRSTPSPDHLHHHRFAFFHPHCRSLPIALWLDTPSVSSSRAFRTSHIAHCPPSATIARTRSWHARPLSPRLSPSWPPGTCLSACPSFPSA